MAKLDLTDIAGGYQTAVAYNANNALIEAAMENTLSLDGTTPNQMQANFDMNSYYLQNVGQLSATTFILNGEVITTETTLVGGLASTSVSFLPDGGSVTTVHDALNDDYVRNDSPNIITGDFSLVGEMDITGVVSSTDTATFPDAVVTNDLTINNDLAVDNDLTVSGAAAITGDFTVTGSILHEAPKFSVQIIRDVSMSNNKGLNSSNFDDLDVDIAEGNGMIYDWVNGRFTPDESGWYWVGGALEVSSISTGTQLCYIDLDTNSAISSGINMYTRPYDIDTTMAHVYGGQIFYLDGVDDYVSIQIRSTNTDWPIVIEKTQTHIYGFKVA